METQETFPVARGVVLSEPQAGSHCDNQLMQPTG